MQHMVGGLGAKLKIRAVALPSPNLFQDCQSAAESDLVASPRVFVCLSRHANRLAHQLFEPVHIAQRSSTIGSVASLTVWVYRLAASSVGALTHTGRDAPGGSGGGHLRNRRLAGSFTTSPSVPLRQSRCSVPKPSHMQNCQATACFAHPACERAHAWQQSSSLERM